MVLLVPERGLGDDLQVALGLVVEEQRAARFHDAMRVPSHLSVGEDGTITIAFNELSRIGLVTAVSGLDQEHVTLAHAKRYCCCLRFLHGSIPFTVEVQFGLN